MAISAAPLEMQAKKPSASISKVKGEARRSATRLKTSWFSHRASINWHRKRERDIKRARFMSRSLFFSPELRYLMY